MLHQITVFVVKHWELSSALVMVTILIFLEEARTKNAHGEQLSPAGVTHAINRQEAVLVDLRDAAAFREGHIIGAKNFPLSEFDRQQEKLDSFRERHLILIDDMGLKTGAIAVRLKKAGFEKIASLKGGMDAWKAVSMPVTKK
ncbi:MAG: rhodanese-like domain-containing protein [Gammaproteobacteria bacterium]|nr:rhodanese-like domain-containing protein [Gammaproteobacteria bacterium]